MPETARFADATSGAVDARRGPTVVSLGIVRRGSAAPFVTAAGLLGGEGYAGPGTRFDLASVSKIVTTLAIMRLWSEGLLDLDAPVRKVIPAFHGGSKDAVTARTLLRHRAGLWEWWPLYADADDGPAVLGDPVEAVARAASLPLRYRPNWGRHYSDLGFQLLGAVVSAVHGSDLPSAIVSLVAGPLGLMRTGYGPVAAPSDVTVTSCGDAWERQMIATGEPYPVPVRAVPASRTHWLRGEANDGNAHHAFGGAAGHAGIFATAGDTARLGAVMFGEHPLWPPPVVAEFAAAGPDPGQALGWRRWEVDGVPVLGHPGFTGTEVAVAPSRGVAWALLTNRLHPTSTPIDVSTMRAQMARIVLNEQN